ncbi:phosphatidylserine decarboxylase [Oikeobacillus pervagus]|uniref:phosphatidylserine decarboxylase n=1 Tax=Oikeobacillus pervagus TaxID=1325931 RepID=A0AAJ1T4Z2_9BACI|nr:phosphatidylserine decarboxylase [Oikeobacillus pervagus]MDQ0216716.1 phosphatidylserine decarboxylase [Oikeobacillus pervagus]
MKESIYRVFIELTNKKWTSNLLKIFTQSSLSRPLIKSFAKVYKINQNEMEYPLAHYRSLHDFFIRRLKPGCRPIMTGEDSVISPVDAEIEEIGTITLLNKMMVKGKEYSIVDLLGDENIAEKYIGGTYMVLYLSPTNYHRIHSPITAEVIQQWELGVHSYPVNKWGLKYGREPLSKNYRSITELRTPNGHLVVAKIGAMFVNSIERIHSNNVWQKGEEVAYFSFGSTVVLLFEEGTFSKDENIIIPTQVKVGQLLGKLHKGIPLP